MGSATVVPDEVRGSSGGELISPADPACRQDRRVHRGLIRMPVRPVSGGSRPNGAPAYYRGRPARVWISVMRPRRRRPAGEQLSDAATICNGHQLAAAVAG